MTDSHSNFQRRAVELALANVAAGGGPFGAVIVREGQIVAEGVNRVAQATDPTAHAEVVAIREACRILKRFQLDDCTIYTSCEPCPMCLSAIYWARLKRVFFANTRKDAARIQFDDDFLYREVGLPIAKRAMPMKQFLRDEAILAFKEWDAKADKIRY